MSGDLDLSPPEVPEPTFFESVLRYGLFLGAIFQLVCILAIILPTSKSHEQSYGQRDANFHIKLHIPKCAPPHQCVIRKCIVPLTLGNTGKYPERNERDASAGGMEEPSEPAEPKTSEPNRKPKAPAQQIRQKLKKESKKKR